MTDDTIHIHSHQKNLTMILEYMEGDGSWSIVFYDDQDNEYTFNEQDILDLMLAWQRRMSEWSKEQKQDLKNARITRTAEDMSE